MSTSMSAHPGATVSGPASPSLSAFQHIFANVYGVQMAGTFVAAVLFGAVTLQGFIYYMNNPNDPILLKALPAWLVMLDAVHQFLYCTGVYRATINNFGNFNILFTINRELFVAAMFQAFITSSAHLFFIYRIWRFAQKKWLIPAITIPISAVQLVLVVLENARNYHDAPASFPATLWMTYTALSVNLLLDTFFMIAMIWLLRHENNSMFSKTNVMVNRLILLTVNTGMTTTLTTAITIILIRAEPSQITYLFFNILIPVLYCNSVLTNLNSREYIRGRRHLMPSNLSLGPSEDPTSILELGNLQFNSKGPSIRASSSAPRDNDSVSNASNPYAATSSKGHSIDKGVKKVTTVTVHRDNDDKDTSEDA